VDKARLVATCDMIIGDCANDVTRYEGAPFDGKTMAAYQGEQNAMISALAGMVRVLVEDWPVDR
jgi:uncharacterized protein YukE